ncbi:MAG: heavy metal-binding domain-containing protein [Bacteroidia bacterium]
MKKIVTLSIFILVLASCSSTPAKTVYACPMDCENGKTYEKAGKCPVCEMDLEAVTK